MDYQAPSTQPKANNDLLSGLSDLNFGDFSEQPQPEVALAKEVPISRTEEVKAFFVNEENKRN
jgi:hypothetical protein